MSGRGRRIELGRADAIGAGAIVALTGVAWLAIVRPVLHAEGERQTQREMIGTLETKEAQLLEDLESIAKRVDEARHLVENHTLDLQPATHINHRLARLGDLAMAMDLSIDVMKSGDPERSGSFDVVPIEIAGTSGFDSFRAFLDRVHSELRDTTVASLEIQVERRGEGTGARFGIELLWHAAGERLVEAGSDE